MPICWPTSVMAHMLLRDFPLDGEGHKHRLLLLEHKGPWTLLSVHASASTLHAYLTLIAQVCVRMHCIGEQRALGSHTCGFVHKICVLMAWNEAFAILRQTFSSTITIQERQHDACCSSQVRKNSLGTCMPRNHVT